ncbi:MAG: heme exporter protein CcmD [Methylococcales bacterium]|nr:MAG: heme exporter protein CcmD [Methylococcales bacterium]
MSLEQFLSMGGYGFYVWTSYGVTFLVLLANIIIPIMQRKQFFVKASKKQRQSL